VQLKSMVCVLLLLAIAEAVVPTLGESQDQKAGATANAPTGLLPADVASRDAIVAALYDSISGPAGERDWARFRKLFTPEAQLIATLKKKDGTLGYKAMTVQDYVDGAGKYFKDHGFYEREISRKVEAFASITHIFSTYESREKPDAKPFERGINSIQLFNDGSRWWIVDVYWTGETPDNSIPERYLSKTVD
jgi:hypothetical protein